MKITALLTILLLAATAVAQTPAATTGTVGKFYVCVDDAARIFVNGEMVHSAGVGTSASRETTLKAGDRVVAQLHESGGGKRFKLLFLSADQKTMVAFQRLAFRIISDRAVVDFTTADWAKWNKYGKAGGGRDDGFPVKTPADWVWGEDNDCAIGANITANMFKPAPLAASARADALPVVLSVESFVDGPSTLYVRRDGVYWINGNNSKPGLLREPTYINGTAWMPKWGTPGEERGFDRSDVSPITLATLDLTVELASNSTERGTDVVDTSRSRIDIKKKPNEIEIVIPDPEPGQRWYKLVFRSRKR
jgi:hypothetical protein